MSTFNAPDFFASNTQRFINEWTEFLSFQSISAIPAHAQDCRDCANWLVRQLAATGFTASLLETSGKPVVFAERRGKAGNATVLFYGHYDVQPVDPLHEWTSPPFKPEVRNGRMYARGAEDNKGQIFAMLKAIETLVSRDELDCSMKVIIEGEEEYGSQGIAGSLEKWRDMLKADILLVCDTNMVKAGVPTIIMGLRGIINLEISLSGPRHDMHSGIHGGIAPNPATEIARLVASLHNPDGSIAVDGMYNSVAEPTSRERTLANAMPIEYDTYMRTTGVPPVAGEKRFTPAERVGFRPTIDINGIHSGYGGPGGKTIIPATAIAKITSRLVAGQDPDTCMKAIIRHLMKHTPTGLNLTIVEQSIGGPGFRLNLDSPITAKASRILKDTFGIEPAFMWEGASVPIVATLAKAAGAEPLLIGFGLDEDKIHAPNESYSLDQLRMGFLYCTAILSSL